MVSYKIDIRKNSRNKTVVSLLSTEGDARSLRLLSTFNLNESTEGFVNECERAIEKGIHGYGILRALRGYDSDTISDRERIYQNLGRIQLGTVGGY